MFCELDFLNPEKGNFDNTYFLREYYQKILFDSCVRVIAGEAGMQDPYDAIVKKEDNIFLLRMELEKSLKALRRDAVDSYAFKVAYALSCMIASVHSDQTMESSVGTPKLFGRLSKLYRASREADKKLAKLFIEGKENSLDSVMVRIKLAAGSEFDDAIGISMLSMAMQASVEKYPKKRYIKHIGVEFLNLTSEELQQIWDVYKDLNPHYKETTPPAGAISYDLPLKVIMSWALKVGEVKYIKILSKRLCLEKEDLANFAVENNIEIYNAVFYSLGKDIPVAAEASHITEAIMMSWALKEEREDCITFFGENLGLSAEETESLTGFYAKAIYGRESVSYVSVNSIMMGWALDEGSIEHIDIFREMMGLEKEDVATYAIARNYNVYGALLYSADEDLHEQVEYITKKFGWYKNKGGKLDALGDFIGRTFKADDIGKFEILMKIPEIQYFVSIYWEVIMEVARERGAYDIISYLEDVDLLPVDYKDLDSLEATYALTTPAVKPPLKALCVRKLSAYSKDNIGGIKALTETSELKAVENFHLLNQIVGGSVVIIPPKKDEFDSGILMNTWGEDTIEQIYAIADVAQHTLETTFLISDPLLGQFSLGEIGESDV